VTPPVTDGALPGISRGRLLEAGLAIELSLSRDEIASADAGCLTNSLSCRVIESIGARTLDAAHPALRRLEMFLAVY
jgi:branched-chain amino acid aminotransferase